MTRRVRRQVRLTILAGALALGLLVGQPAGAMLYSLADDYSATVNTGTSTWSYRGKSDLTRDGSYTLLPTSTTGVGGVEVWQGSGGLPLVGKNGTGVTVTSGSFSLPNGAALMHPSQGGLSVASWLAPANMTVNLRYQFADADSSSLGNGDNGIQWFVERNNQAVTLGADLFAAGGNSGVRILNNVTVSAGDRINFVVDPNGSGGSNYWYDSTRVDARISTDPWPVPTLINFDINGRDTNDPAGAVTYTGAAAVGSAGDFWNSRQITSKSVPTLAASHLMLADGATETAVGFSVSRVGSGLSNLSADILTDGHAVNALLGDYVYAHGPGTEGPTELGFVIDGLTPDGLYDIYLYGTAGDWGNNTQFTIGGLTRTATGGFAGFAGGQSYVSFLSAIATGGRISGTVSDPSGYAVFNGFQIMGEFAVIPEPATLLLLGLGGLLLRRRRA